MPGRKLQLHPEARPNRDRPFDPWRIPAADNLRDFVGWVTRIFESREQKDSPRSRKRTAAQTAALSATITAIVCDASHCALTRPDGRIMVSLSNTTLGRASRYKAPAVNKAIPKVLDTLKPDILIVEPGGKSAFFGGYQTTFSLSQAMRRDLLRHYKVTPQDIARGAGEELIVLKGSKSDRDRKSEEMEYADTDETNAYRGQVKRINTRLGLLDLGFEDSEPGTNRIDLSDRHVRRFFNNGRFDHGGRLFGGFWLGLSKEKRGQSLTISGESIATIDFKQMAPRLLYAEANQTPPSDCYAVPGYEDKREGWKMLLNSMFHSGPNLRRMPQGVRAKLGHGLDVAEATRLLLEFHTPIKHLIREEVGMELMFRESQILIEALLRLEEKDVPALPIHDAVLVPTSLKEAAAETLKEAFKTITGAEGDVTIEV